MSESDEDDGPSALVLYQTEDGRARIECVFEDETLWLTQAQMAVLFQSTIPNINIHLKAVYAEGELSQDATIKSRLIVRTEGSRQVTRKVLHYSLPAVLAVGFRVRSPRGTLFRTWATERLNEYLVKGFTMDDARLKNPPGPGVPDYFDELLERIRDIRASERRMYLRVRDILALAADYAPKDEETQLVFQTVQNKLLFAATGKTAPELVFARANAEAPNMGLTSWSGDAIRKQDITVSKNYLHAPEIEELNRIVVMFLDFAEDQARRRKQIFIRDWRERIDDFLRFNDRDVLPNSGSVLRRDADAHAAAEYKAFSARARAARETEGADALEQLASHLEKRPHARRTHKQKDEE